MRLLLHVLILSVIYRTANADYCRLKTKTSCIGSIKSYKFLDYSDSKNPFGTNDFFHTTHPFGSHRARFFIGLADLDNDGDQDMLLGLSSMTGVEYYKNIATRADLIPTWQKINSDGPFDNLATSTGHWAPEKHSQATFYDMDNDGDLDLVLAGLKGKEREMTGRDNLCLSVCSFVFN